MSTPTFTIGTLLPTEIDELLSLQNENLVQRIDPETANKEGFVTFKYSPLIIRRMMQDMAQPVARADDDVIGYALATSRESCKDNELMKPLEKLCRELQYKGRPLTELRYYFMGQVCIKREWRGMGLFDALYAHHASLFSEQYDCLITEITVTNTRSMAAHTRFGFEIIHTYNEGETTWNVMLWELRK